MDPIKLIKKYSLDKNSYDRVLTHSKKVNEIAMRIARQIQGVDLDFVNEASMLHDIGRFSAKKVIQHGIEGARILKEEGYDERFQRVCCCHLGAGISKEEIKKKKLDLPLADYEPISIEEKIITVADNLVFGFREGTIDEVLYRFEKELGKDVARKVEKLYNEVMSLTQ